MLLPLVLGLTVITIQALVLLIKWTARKIRNIIS